MYRHILRSVTTLGLVLTVMILTGLSQGALARSASVPSAPSNKVRVAILPLTTPKNQPDLEQFGIGTMDTLIQALANVPQFVMIDRARIETILKEQQLSQTGLVDQKSAVAIGKLVGAQILVTGNLIKAGDKIRITAHFTEMKTGQISRSEAVTGPIDSIFELMDQLAQKFIAEQGVQLTQQEQQRVSAATRATASLSAYDYYQKGRAAYLQFTVPGYQEAVDWFQKAIDVDAKYAQAYAGAGAAYGLWGYARQTNGDEHQSYYDKALDFSQKAIQLNPDLGEAHRALAETYLELTRWKDAETEAKRAIEINANDAEAYYLLWRSQDSTEVEATAIRRALEINPDLAAAQLDLGYAFYQKGNYAEAIKHYKESLRVSPRSDLTHNNLGLVFLNQGNLDAAITEFRTVLDINPRYVLALNNLGLAYEKQGNLEQAGTYYKKALEINPRYALGWRNLGGIYRNQGHYDDALQAYTKASEIDPGNVDTVNDIGLVYTDKGQWELAIPYFKQVLEKDKNYIYGHHNMGWSYYNLGRYEEAVSAYERALLINPDYVASRNNLGLALQQLGRPDEAETHFRKAAELDPTYPFPHFNLGGIYEKRGESAKAADEYELYLKLRPSYSGAAELRAKIQRLRTAVK